MLSSKTGSEASSQRKRKYLDCGTGNPQRKGGAKGGANTRNPKRGGPGILLTCETGRETKCRREGLMILDFYLTTKDAESKAKGLETDPTGNTDHVANLSLDEELKQLRSKKSTSETTTFQVYDTGCRGSVFVLCNLPQCQLIEPIETEYQRAKAEEANKTSRSIPDNLDVGVNKSNMKEHKAAAKCEEKRVDIPGSNLIWDPIGTIDSIMSDRITNSNPAAPCSRFVTRMIPIQATCFASQEELQLTSTALLEKYLPRDTKTFAVVSKRRNCGNLTRDKIIDIIASALLTILPNCKVKIDDPEITILVEICRTICGMSVLKKSVREYKNFNLIAK